MQFPKPTVASYPRLLTEQEYRNYGLRGDRHVNLIPLGPPAYDPARPDIVHLNRPSEQGSTQLRQPTLTPPVLLSEQEYRSYGLRGERQDNKTHVGPPAQDPYRTEQEREGTHPDTVFLSRPSEQEPMQLPKPTSIPPVLLTEQEYRSYGLRGERHNNLTNVGPSNAGPSIYEPYKTDQEREGVQPDAVSFSRPSEQETMHLQKPSLTPPPTLLTEQDYRSYGLRGERRSNFTPTGPSSYDPYKNDQVKESARPDSLFLTEKDYRAYGLKARKENPTSVTSAIPTSVTSAINPTNPSISYYQADPPYNPYDDHTSSLVERYLSHPMASTSAPSGSYRFDTTRVVDDRQFHQETVLPDRQERLYAMNAIPNTLSDHNQSVGQRQDEHVNRSAPVSSRYAFTGNR